jgi:quinol-cytochrome oxidoreductase complex cytochrome b subunit
MSLVSFSNRVWRSIRRVPLWPQDDRGRMRLSTSDLILHLHATRVPKAALKLTYTFGLGGLSILLLVMLIGTGMLLMFSYTPSTEEAYSSIITLETEVWFGQLVRNLHHWSGNLLIVVAFLHMLRVFYTGTFRTPREFNWILGLTLLMLAMAASFTGYLLPWDQLSYWAVTVMMGLVERLPLVGETLRGLLLGGDEVGETTLRNFFAFHVILIPLGFLVVGSFHIWRVRKDKGSIPHSLEEAESGEPKRQEMVTTIPHLVSVEVVYGLVAIALLLSWASMVDAPLLDAADPNMPPNPAKAAWYFAGLQELLLHFHPDVAAVIIPLLTVILLLYTPYARDDEAERNTGVWFRSRRGRRLATLSYIAGTGITALLILLSETGDLASLLPSWDERIAAGYLPLAVIVVVIWLFMRLLRRGGATHGERHLALFTLLLASFITLTVIGNLFRGPGWALMMPWEVFA